MNQLNQNMTMGQVTNGEASPEFDIDLVRYWNIAYREKWGILGFVVAICALTIVIVVNVTPIYRSTATLLIEAKEANVVSIEEIYGVDASQREYYQTQFEILGSRNLAEDVIRNLDLVNHPVFQFDAKKPLIAWRRWIPFLPSPKQPTEEQKWPAVVNSLQSNLFVEPVRNTQLVKISFESSDPDLTYKVANALGNAYVDDQLDARLQLTQKASGWLTGRLGGMRDNLEASEKALQVFREQENLVDVSGVQTITANELDEITRQLVQTRNIASEAKSQMESVGNVNDGYASRWETSPGVLKDSFVRRAKTEESEASTTLSELSQRYGPKHPKILAAKSNYNTAVLSFQSAVFNVVKGFAKTYEQALADQRELEKSLERSKAEIQDINRKRYRLSELAREVDANRQIYDLFFTRYKETSETSFAAANARFIDVAVKPFSPIKPKKTQIVLLAGLLAGIVGVMLAFLKSTLDNTVKAGTEVEEKLHQPVLGVLPIMKDLMKTKSQASLAYLDKRYNSFSEAVRTIRTGVILSGVDVPKKKLLVTSSIPNEGKTTMALSLALSLGQMEKVVLIDADMRKPSIAHGYNLSQGTCGLSEIIAGTEDVKDCIHTMESSGIDLIPSGVVPPNPLELLSSKRFASLIEQLAERYDRVIIDSAPTQAVSDSLVLSDLADAVIYVVKADSTTTQVILSGLQRLERVNASIIGVVLNQFDSSSAAKYGHYGKEYYDYYGYGGNKTYG